ncbi:MAG: hypothetical protein WC284_14685 [Candidimonas sp.]
MKEIDLVRYGNLYVRYCQFNETKDAIQILDSDVIASVILEKFIDGRLISAIATDDVDIQVWLIELALLKYPVLIQSTSNAVAFINMWRQLISRPQFSVNLRTKHIDRPYWIDQTGEISFLPNPNHTLYYWLQTNPS